MMKVAVTIPHTITPSINYNLEKSPALLWTVYIPIKLFTVIDHNRLYWYTLFTWGYFTGYDGAINWGHYGIYGHFIIT